MCDGSESIVLQGYTPRSFALWQPLGFLSSRDLTSLRVTSKQMSRFVALFELPYASRNRQRSFRHDWIDACGNTLTKFKHTLLETLPLADAEASLDLKRALGDATRYGIMPCFNNIGALSGYIEQRFGTRSLNLLQLLFIDSVKDRAPMRTWLEQSFLTAPVCNVLSIGGGSGFEAAGLSAMMGLLGLDMKLTVTSYDVEPLWDFSARKLHEILNKQHLQSPQLRFDLCDILSSLYSPMNKQLLQAVPTAHMFVFSYVVVENAAALAGGSACTGDKCLQPFEFFVQLWSEARVGSTLVCMDSTDRHWALLLHHLLLGLAQSAQTTEPRSRVCPCATLRAYVPKLPFGKSHALVLRKLGPPRYTAKQRVAVADGSETPCPVSTPYGCNCAGCEGCKYIDDVMAKLNELKARSGASTLAALGGGGDDKPQTPAQRACTLGPLGREKLRDLRKGQLRRESVRAAIRRQRASSHCTPSVGGAACTEADPPR
jgi:hypothetical protein